MSKTRCEPAAQGVPRRRRRVMREINIEIYRVGSRFGSGDDLYSFVCECGNPNCRSTIDLHLHRFDPATPAGSLLAHGLDGEQEPLT